MRVPRHPVQGIFQDVCPPVALVVDELAFIGELDDEGLGRADSSREYNGHPRFVEVFRQTPVVGGSDEVDRFADEFNRHIRRGRFARQQRHVVHVFHVVWHDRTPANVGHLEHRRETKPNRVERLVRLYQDRGARPGVTISLQREVDVGSGHAGPPPPCFAIGRQRPR